MKKQFSLPEELSVVNLMTPSLNKILDLFDPLQIKEIIARAKTTESLNDSYNEVVGAKFFEKKEHKLFLHYSCIPPNTKHNPLTKTHINNLKKEMGRFGIEDATVNLLKVTLTLKNIKSLFKKYDIKFLKETDTEFLATFVEETKVEPIVRKVLEDMNDDLFGRLKFHRSLLVCRKLIPEKFIYSLGKIKRNYLINLERNWKEDCFDAIQSPTMIVQQIKPRLGDYGYIRYYKETSSNILEFVRGE